MKQLQVSRCPQTSPRRYVSRRYLAEKWDALKWYMENVIGVYKDGGDDVSEDAARWDVADEICGLMKAIAKEIAG